MGLFFDVLSAINDPNQQGSVAQLETVTKSIQQVAANQGIESSKLQSILSAVGGFIGPAMQQQQKLAGGGQLENLIGQIAGTGAAATALQTLFPPQLQQQMIQGIAQRTGVSASTLQGMLPSLLPAIMGLLNMGAGKPGSNQGNPLLNAFVGGGGGSNTDLGEVFKFANRFLNPPQY
jgi:hypothetical protein